MNLTWESDDKIEARLSVLAQSEITISDEPHYSSLEVDTLISCSNWVRLVAI